MPTEAKDIFEATSRSVRELLTENGLGLYIPPYQRPYGWDRGKVEKLLDDTLHGLTMLLKTDESFTFLGTIITIHDIKYTTVQPIVREEVPAKVLTIIDGQQRLSTLLLISVCLHNQIRLRHWKIFKGKQPSSDDPVLTWINGQTLSLLKDLSATIFERQAYGDSPIYPRMIRAFTDQWSRKSDFAQYKSPIAHMIATYSSVAELEKPTEFRPEARDDTGEGEADLVKRYNELRTTLRKLAGAEVLEDLESIPSLEVASESREFQRALLNHEFPDDVIGSMKSPPSSEFGELLRLVLLGAYILNRVALTVVKGRSEDYAFTIFESLNTTGEPLTAFETFKPRVVSAEGLAKYEQSESRTYMDNVADYLSEYRVGGQLQNATRDLLVTFAMAETGEKLSKRLADQRSYLKDEFDRYGGNQQQVAFIRHLRDTAAFTDTAWLYDRKDESPHLSGLPADSTTDVIKLCMSFLRELNHTIAIGALVRFYSEARNAELSEQANAARQFEQAIKALTAFSVLWRTSRRTTGNIDREYREIMSGVGGAASGGGLTGLGPLARSLQRGSDKGTMPVVDVVGLKEELVARLADSTRGGVAGPEDWISQSSMLPIYQTSRQLTRFILLSAYHDTVEDPAEPGLIVKGKEASGSCFTFEGWRDEKHLSLEHVAPQGANQSWSPELYTEKEAIHRLGNLVLVPQDANSSLSMRPWEEKRVLYAALGAASKGDAAAILERAADGGITFADSTEQLVQLSKYMPHLAALGNRKEEWGLEFVGERSRRLLGLAWATLRPWLD